VFAHDADIGVRGVGPTREVAFEQGAIALMHAIRAPAATWRRGRW
jgi:tRNA nucleotidyltransferase (CCA-adding enzyme)